MGLYNVYIETKTQKIKINATPMTHKEACTFLSKVTKYKWRNEYLEGV